MIQILRRNKIFSLPITDIHGNPSIPLAKNSHAAIDTTLLFENGNKFVENEIW